VGVGDPAAKVGARDPPVEGALLGLGLVDGALVTEVDGALDGATPGIDTEAVGKDDGASETPICSKVGAGVGPPPSVGALVGAVTTVVPAEVGVDEGASETAPPPTEGAGEIEGAGETPTAPGIVGAELAAVDGAAVTFCTACRARHWVRFESWRQVN
jgi:hypothetical protein